MINNTKRKSIILISLFIVVCAVVLCAVFGVNSVYAVTVSLEEADAENVDSMRYGYNVTAGRPLFDEGLVRKAPILKPMSEGLYKHIDKEENNGKTDGGSETGYSAIEIAQKSASALSGGVSTNIKFVSMNIDTAFNTNTSMSNVYNERFETYYQKINRVRYQIQDTTDLRDYLSPYFENDLYNVAGEGDALALFDKYGTHLFTGLQYGGMLQVTNYICTNKNTVDITQAMSLSTKMDVAFNVYGAGTSFSVSEQYEAIEKKEYGTSNYKIALYGGESVTVLTLDQLFTYNGSLVDGKGNYVYDRWVRSINDGERLSIIGTTESSRAVPLWEFLKDGGEYNSIRNCLIRAYANLCGDKYNEYLEKYPTKKRVIGSEQQSVGVCDVKGYSVTYKNNTVTYPDSNNTGMFEVPRKAMIFINYTDTIPVGKKMWKITKGAQNVKVVDALTGIFEVTDSASAKDVFTVELFSGDKSVYNKEFTVAEVKFSGGDGSIDKDNKEVNPYLISTKDDFLFLIRESTYWGKSFRLTGDIDLGGEVISSIGDKNNPFTGIFDGNNCRISNFKIDAPIDQSLALFAYNAGTLKNLNITEANIECVASAKNDESNKAVRYAGGIVGYNKGALNNCRVSKSVINVKYYSSDDFNMFVGGLTGHSEGVSGQSRLERCAAVEVNIKAICNNGTGAEPSRDYNTNCIVGGIAGKIDKCMVINSYVRLPSLSAQAIGKTAKAYAGGLIGCTDEESIINYCVVGDIQSIIAKKAGYSDSESIKTTFIGKNFSAKISYSYVQKMPDMDSGTSDVVKQTDKVTLKACDKFSGEDWTEGDNAFPVLKTQTFDLNNALSINCDNAKKEYYIGEKFNIAGVEVTGHSAAEDISVKEFEYDASKYRKDAIGTYQIVVKAMGYSAIYEVTVRKIRVVGLDIVPIKDDFYVDDIVKADDFRIDYILENGERTSPSADKLDYIEYPSEKIEWKEMKYVSGENKVEATCGELSGQAIVRADEKEIVKLKITQSPTGRIYREGDKFDLTGWEITAEYSDGSERILKTDEIEVIGEKIAYGENIITIASQNYVTEVFTVSGLAGNKQNAADNSQNKTDSMAVVLILCFSVVVMGSGAICVLMLLKKKNRAK